MRKIKYAFFDLDNTLTDRASTVRAYAQYFVSEFQTHLKFSVTAKYLGDVFNQLDQGGYQTHINRSKQILELDIWKTKSSITYTDVSLSDHWQQWVPNHSQPMLGLHECLSELKHMGLSLCLVSNGQSRNQRDKIKKLDIEQYFDHIVISQELGIEKPDPRIFEHALKLMQCQSSESVFIGDHPINDYQGSQALGFTAIWLSGSHKWPEDFASPLMIHQLSQLCPLIKTN